MKKFGFVSWWAIVSATIITLLVDAMLCTHISKVGGFAAWKASNIMWDVALAYLFVWHIFYVFVFWVVYICNKD